MVVDTKLYDLLGVAPDANEKDLKKAFMQKARELHPDKNRDDPQATEKFQAVNEAYEILKDPQKRQMYDQYGPEGLKDGGGRGADIFSHIFGGSFFGGGGGGRPRRQRTRDVQYPVKASLEDLYNGKEITLKINRQCICPGCSGNGTQSGKAPQKCTECQGRGQKMQVRQMGMMITQQVVTCPTCKGTGEMIAQKDKCKKCHGNKVIDEDKKVKVIVERGMEDGDTIRFQGCSDEAPGADTGDLVVQISQKKHDTFIRKHDDLLIKKKITLTEALLGTKFPITHLDGRQLIITSKPGEIISPGMVKIIEREGMPRRGNQFDRGSLFIAFEVEFPPHSKITPALKAELEKALPPPNETAGINMDDENVVPVTLKPSDLKTFESAKKSTGSRQREAYDAHEDDYDDGGGVGCQPM